MLAGINKCLSSMVPSAVTMDTATGFSSCAALKNVRRTYNAVFPLGGSWPTMQQRSQGLAEAYSGAGLTPCALSKNTALLVSLKRVSRSFLKAKVAS